ncbi:MAG: hypothetical protein Q4A07_07200 [Coriobacteriales bacterium]|nr:hypothetical protein [Coriobacteriales bacterium]
MYHEITAKDRNKKRRRRLQIIVAIVVCAVALVLVSNSVREGAREQGAAALRQSILSAAMRCCAIEGSYPLSLKRLEDDYGIRINHDDYIITYEAYASNMPPSVVVVPR